MAEYPPNKRMRSPRNRVSLQNRDYEAYYQKDLLKSECHEREYIKSKNMHDLYLYRLLLLRNRGVDVDHNELRLLNLLILEEQVKNGSSQILL